MLCTWLSLSLSQTQNLSLSTYIYIYIYAYVISYTFAHLHKYVETHSACYAYIHARRRARSPKQRPCNRTPNERALTGAVSSCGTRRPSMLAQQTPTEQKNTSPRYLRRNENTVLHPITAYFSLIEHVFRRRLFCRCLPGRYQRAARPPSHEKAENGEVLLRGFRTLRCLFSTERICAVASWWFDNPHQKWFLGGGFLGAPPISLKKAMRCTAPSSTTRQSLFFSSDDLRDGLIRRPGVCHRPGRTSHARKVSATIPWYAL